MIPPPKAIGLTLCDQVILEAGTNKVSLIGSFTGIRAESFPHVPLPFCVFASLIDGMGEGVLELTVTQLETDDEIHTLRRTIQFPDRFMEVRTLFRMTECSFPVPGVYLFTFLIDGEWMAHRRVRVYLAEDTNESVSV